MVSKGHVDDDDVIDMSFQGPTSPSSHGQQALQQFAAIVRGRGDTQLLERHKGEKTEGFHGEIMGNTRGKP